MLEAIVTVIGWTLLMGIHVAAITFVVYKTILDEREKKKKNE